MPQLKPWVLVADEDLLLCSSIYEALTEAGYSVARANERAKVLETLKHPMQCGSRRGIDLLVVSSAMEGLAARVRSEWPELPVVMLVSSNPGFVGGAARALKGGVAATLPRQPLDLRALKDAVQAALAGPVALVTEPERPLELIGESPAWKSAVAMAERVAPYTAPVLITGATGTGKELIARLIHAKSGRGDGPFVAVNCAAMPEHLLESELFGHVKGAFTGAHADNAGLCVTADGGTLLLDELPDLPMRLQSKLLRFLQDSVVRPVGGTATRRVGVRVIAATSVDLENQIWSASLFRADLFYRLNVLSVTLPLLSERDGDVRVLAEHFTRTKALQFGKPIRPLTSAALTLLESYHWPGNVRELEHTIERAVIMAPGDQIDVDALPKRLQPIPAAA